MKNKRKIKREIKLLKGRVQYLTLKLIRYGDALTKHAAELELHSGLLSLKPIQQKEESK